MGNKPKRDRDSSSSTSKGSQDEKKSHQKKPKQNHVDPAASNVLKNTMTTRSASSANSSAPPQSTPSTSASVITPSSTQTPPIPVIAEKNSAKAKIQAIIIQCDNKAASDVITSVGNKIKFPATIGTSSNGRTKIVCSSKDDKIAVVDALKKSNLEFYSHPEKDERELCYIMKGLSGYDDTEVNSLLKVSLNSFTPKATRISKPGSENPVFRVQFSGNILSLEYLRHNFRYIGHFRVTWEAKRKDRERVTQCFRCQEFGHVASQCNRNFRCVKCSKDHGPGKCTRTDKDDTEVPLKCANCGANHTANFIDCPKRKEFLLRKKKSASRQSTASHLQPRAQKMSTGSLQPTLNPHQRVDPSAVPSYTAPGPPAQCPWTQNQQDSITTVPTTVTVRDPELDKQLIDSLNMLQAQNQQIIMQFELLSARITSLEAKVEQLQDTNKDRIISSTQRQQTSKPVSTFFDPLRKCEPSIMERQRQIDMALSNMGYYDQVHPPDPSTVFHQPSAVG